MRNEPSCDARLVNNGTMAAELLRRDTYAGSSEPDSNLAA